MTLELSVLLGGDKKRLLSPSYGMSGYFLDICWIIAGFNGDHEYSNWKNCEWNRLIFGSSKCLPNPKNPREHSEEKALKKRKKLGLGMGIDQAASSLPKMWQEDRIAPYEDYMQELKQMEEAI
jgi:hypothetical protein